MIKTSVPLTEAAHERVNEIASDLGINASDAHRRALGLLSIAHGLLKNAGEDVYICTKNPDGTFQQQHVISELMY